MFRGCLMSNPYAVADDLMECNVAMEPTWDMYLLVIPLAALIVAIWPFGVVMEIADKINDKWIIRLPFLAELAFVLAVLFAGMAATGGWWCFIGSVWQ